MERLLKLKNAELTSILRVCGFSTSGSQKMELADAIHKNMEPLFPVDKPLRLMAVDVGLVNFSFAKLSLPNGLYSTPVLTQWYKMDLFTWTGIPRDSHPSVFAELINRVVFDVIYAPESEFPDLVLVERQRFRTMGNKNVFEHILRTNMLESMLYSSMETLRRQNDKYKSIIVPTSPQTMVNYWSPSQKSSKQSKEMRMALVDHWLGQCLAGQQSKFAIDTPLGTDSPKAKSSSRRIYDFMELFNEQNESNISLSQAAHDKRKGDDLADSLLYGLSWVDYERNKDTLSKATDLKKTLDDILDKHSNEVSRILDS